MQQPFRFWCPALDPAEVLRFGGGEHVRPSVSSWHSWHSSLIDDDQLLLLLLSQCLQKSLPYCCFVRQDLERRRHLSAFLVRVLVPTMQLYSARGGSAGDCSDRFASRPAGCPRCTSSSPPPRALLIAAPASATCKWAWFHRAHMNCAQRPLGGELHFAYLRMWAVGTSTATTSTATARRASHDGDDRDRRRRRQRRCQLCFLLSDRAIIKSSAETSPFERAQWRKTSSSLSVRPSARA